MTRSSLKIIFLSMLFTFLGCQTSGVIIAESNKSVSDHRRAIVAALGEPKTISQNGREMTTHYHDRNFKYLEITPTTKRRLYTKAIVLGARRPYDISVEVRIEERDPETNAFQDIGPDEDLSLARALAIKEVLNQSRDRLQTIDGSNPF